jgi:hypothetical protein
MGVRIALVVLTVFAALWAWAALLFSGAAPGLNAIPIAVSLALLVSGWRASGVFPTRGRHVGSVVGLWSGIEVVALVVSVNVLQHFQRADLMFPLAAIIVGLHFFPLARGIPVRLYYGTGAGLVAAGLVGLLLPAAQRPVAVGIGAALVLWATALAIVLQGRRRTASASSVG